MVPQQALAVSNSELVHSASVDTAKLIAVDGAEAFIRAAFLQLLSRSATSREVTVCMAFWERQARELKNEDRVRESLVRVLFNHNDFVTIR